MKFVFSLVILATMAILCCATIKKSPMQNNAAFDFEAHRGGRGLMPENTIPAMKNGIDLGATTLEMDVVISKDNKVVVSHDPFFNDVITTTPDGKFLTKKEAPEYLLYKMDYDSIKKFDVGMKPHPTFPRQQKIKVNKPLLSDLLEVTEAYAKSKGIKIKYNIEIKSVEGFDGIRHPAPPAFAELLLKVISEKKVTDRTIIQSFDVRPLQYLHKTHPGIVLSYLVEKTTTTLEEQLNKLGFVPQVYSPIYTMVTKDLVDQSHSKKMKVVPWTINTLQEIKDIMATGVDGIISDYPDLFAGLEM